MNKQEKIDAIYKEIANKELSFGCKIQAIETNCIGYYIEDNYNDAGYIEIEATTFSCLRENIKVIGHDVMIGNCDKLIEKGPNYFEDWNTILDLWIKKGLPIEEQSEECINYVFNFLSKN